MLWREERSFFYKNAMSSFSTDELEADLEPQGKEDNILDSAGEGEQDQEKIKKSPKKTEDDLLGDSEDNYQPPVDDSYLKDYSDGNSE